MAAKVVLVMVAFFAAFMGYRVVQFGLYLRSHPSQSTPGQAAFMEANRQIISSHGETGFGNTPEAVAMAKTFSKEFKSLREEFFTKGKGNDDVLTMLTGSDFPTYCEMNSNACVFLVHVPELRRFTGDAKKTLGHLAWSTAQKTVKNGVGTPPAQLVVGVKGELYYDPILIGKFVSDLQDPGEGIQGQQSGLLSMPVFYPFFANEENAANN